MKLNAKYFFPSTILQVMSVLRDETSTLRSTATHRWPFKVQSIKGMKLILSSGPERMVLRLLGNFRVHMLRMLGQ